MQKSNTEQLVETKTLKVSMKTYNRLGKEIQDYQDTMDVIISRLLDEIDECRRSGKTRK